MVDIVGDDEVFLSVFGERAITLRFDFQALWLCDYRTTRIQLMQTTANYELKTKAKGWVAKKLDFCPSTLKN